MDLGSLRTSGQKLWQSFIAATTPTLGEFFTTSTPTDPVTRLDREYEAQKAQLMADEKKAERKLANPKFTKRQQQKARADLRNIQRALWVLETEYTIARKKLSSQ